MKNWSKKIILTMGSVLALIFLFFVVFQPKQAWLQTSNNNNSTTGNSTTTTTTPCLYGPTYDVPVCIINMAQSGQVFTGDSEIIMQTIPGISEVEMLFSGSDFDKIGFAQQDASDPEYWRFNLVTQEFGNGNFHLQTIANFPNLNDVFGDSRDFEIMVDDSTTTNISVELLNPNEGDQISGIYDFYAQADRYVDTFYFHITNSSSITLEHLQGIPNATGTTGTYTYQAEFDTTVLNDGEYFVNAEAIDSVTNESAESENVLFYINNLPTTSTTTPTTTPPNVELWFNTPQEGDILSKRALIRVDTNQSVDGVTFRIDGYNDLFEPSEIDLNHWQMNIDTTQYENGSYQLVATASKDGISYNSDSLGIFIENEIEDPENPEDPTTEPEDLEDTDNPTTDPEDLVDSEDLEDINNPTTDQEDSDTSNDICDGKDVSNLTCVSYLNRLSEITTDCAATAIDVTACLDRNEKCKSDGINEYSLCEKYLNEPRPARWCNDEEFYNQPLCQNHRQQLAIKAQEKKTTRLAGSADLPQVCLDQQVFDKEKCNKLVNVIKIPQECKEQGIYSEVNCEEYLKRKYVDPICKQQGITNEDECRDYLVEQSKQLLRCDSGDCRKIVKQKYTSRLAAHQAKMQKVKNAINNKKNTTIIIPEESVIASADQDTATIVEQLPVHLKSGTKMRVIPAEDVINVSEEEFTPLFPAVIVHDSDGDGLPDEMELRLGTDPHNVDTDGDSYWDGEEIKNGYDPLKPLQELEKTLAAVEIALANGSILEHPIVSGNESEEVAVLSIADREIIGAEVGNSDLTMTGIGQPFQVHTLYIYSDLPMVITVQADEEGHWEYTLKDSLVDGEHQVFVVINDETGKVVKKSKGFTFFVQEAQAVTADEYIATALPAESSKLERYYIYGAVGMVVLALIIITFLYREVKKKSTLEEV